MVIKRQSKSINDQLSGNLATGTKEVKMPGLGDTLKFQNNWLEHKRSVDKVDSNLWRIHDKLYNLENFAKIHPGGRQWIDLTKGTDITESFEVSHLFEDERGNALLKKYFVRDCYEPRTTTFTFDDDGFYKSLKKRVRPILQAAGTGPNNRMLFIQDSLVMVYHILFVGAAWNQSLILSIMAGIALGMTASCAHNFFHQRNNWRRFYFDLSVLGSSKWRISHALSHHLYTNTFQDYEVSTFYPYIDFYVEKKNYYHKILGPVVSHLWFFLIAVVEMITKILLVVLRIEYPYREEFIPLLYLAILGFSSSTPLQGLGLFILMQCTCTYWVSFTSLIATHHHPLVYHSGDEPHPKSRDWGVHQLDTVRDVEKSPSLFLVATSFGNHLLHHLFPTVDHSKLDLLWPSLIETCREFGFDYQYLSQGNMFVGLHRQIAREKSTTFDEREKLRCPQKI